MNDTIAAIATAWGEAGIAIVRVSGPDAVAAARSVLKFGPSGFPPPREMRLALLTYGNGTPADQVLAVHFAAPKSYTGEDVVEIHSHGGIFVARTCLDMLLEHGVRAAEPGEFTRRAFLNGRMDLTRAESVLGIIKAQSEEALRSAALTLTGGLSGPVEKIRAELLTLQGNIEVGLDFPEGETALIDGDRFRDALVSLAAELEKIEERCAAGALLREGLSVVIAGRPNAGKSSLLNAMLGRDRAIVTDIPGTTRDIIEETVIVSGIPLRVADTAGLRESNEAVEAIGVERARNAAASADICLWLLDSSCPVSRDDLNYISSLNPANSVIVLSKSDLPRAVSAADAESALPDMNFPVITLSVKTGDGLAELRDKIISMALGGAEPKIGLSEGLNVTARQLDDIRSCLRSVKEALKANDDEMGEDVTAGALGRARLSLDKLLGKSYDDDLLDSVFSRFCVGK